MIRALADFDELAGAVVAAKDTVHAAISCGKPGVAGVTGHPDLVFLGNRNNALEEEGHALPVLIG